jgi:hypothetical protein
MSFKDVMTQVSRFNTLTTAETYRTREAGRWIVLGDNGEYWVTTRRYAVKLVAFGYEMLDS